MTEFGVSRYLRTSSCNSSTAEYDCYGPDGTYWVEYEYDCKTGKELDQELDNILVEDFRFKSNKQESNPVMYSAAASKIFSLRGGHGFYKG